MLDEDARALVQIGSGLRKFEERTRAIQTA
jgi:hypothetical protein